MKKILFVTTGLAYGGAETQLQHIAIRLRSRGWEVSVVSMLPPVAYVEELERVGIRIYDLHMRRKVPDPRALLRLRTIIRAECPSVVHAHMVHANLLARLTRLITQVPVLICTAHSIIEGGRLREIAYRLTDRFADMSTQVCEAGRHRYIKVGAVPPHKIVYIPNGIDSTEFRPNPQVREAKRQELAVADAFVWLIVGRLEPVKAHLTLLNAFKQVSEHHTDAILLIAGQGPLRKAIEAKTAALGIEAKVRLLGIRRDIPALMNAADALVLSSLWEGTSIVLLEASACALPIVATDVGGNPEIVLANKTGFLVKPSSPEELAEAMLHLMSLPLEVRQAMGQAGRAHIVANYDLERIVDRWEALYQELLNRKRR